MRKPPPWQPGRGGKRRRKRQLERETQRRIYLRKIVTPDWCDLLDGCPLTASQSIRLQILPAYMRGMFGRSGSILRRAGLYQTTTQVWASSQRARIRTSNGSRKKSEPIWAIARLPRRVVGVFCLMLDNAREKHFIWFQKWMRLLSCTIAPRVNQRDHFFELNG